MSPPMKPGLRRGSLQGGRAGAAEGASGRRAARHPKSEAPACAHTGPPPRSHRGERPREPRATDASTTPHGGPAGGGRRGGGPGGRDAPPTHAQCARQPPRRGCKRGPKTCGRVRRLAYSIWVPPKRELEHQGMKNPASGLLQVSFICGWFGFSVVAASAQSRGTQVSAPWGSRGTFFQPPASWLPPYSHARAQREVPVRVQAAPPPEPAAATRQDV